MTGITSGNRQFFKGKPLLWFLIGALCIISVIEVFSATSRMTFGAGQNYLRPVLGHVMHLVFGLGVMYLVHLVHYRYFKIIPYILLPIAAALLLYLLARSLATGQTVRWITLPGFSFQPSELAKMGVVTAVASMLSKMDEKDADSQSSTFWKIMILTIVFFCMIVTENLSTAILLALTVYAMMFFGLIRRKYLLSLLAAGAGFGAIMLSIMLFVPPQKIADSPLPSRFVTWQARVLDYKDGSKNLTEKEYVRNVARDKPQETHANIAIASSNIFGKGPGNSVERDFLQEASCDFIYAIIIEELGLVGALIVMGIYLWLLLKVGGITSQCGDKKYPRYLAMGIITLITLQALINMAVAVGLMPVTGQPLPLISTGGTSILVTCVYFGIIISISWSAVGDTDTLQNSETIIDNGQD